MVQNSFWLPYNEVCKSVLAPHFYHQNKICLTISRLRMSYHQKESTATRVQHGIFGAKGTEIEWILLLTPGNLLNCDTPSFEWLFNYLEGTEKSQPLIGASGSLWGFHRMSVFFCSPLLSPKRFPGYISLFSTSWNVYVKFFFFFKKWIIIIRRRRNQ